MKNKDTVTSFERFYRSVYDRADAIFRESNLCQWEQNQDGTFSCVINRKNSRNNPRGFTETDGCCIEICKNPADFNDPLIKKRQHSEKTGCLVKSLKCKLHICGGLVRMSEKDPIVKKYIDEIEKLQKLFMAGYEKLWRAVPYAVSKSMYIKYFEKFYGSK